MSKKYLFIGEHAETLASGRRVAPGDELPADAVDPDDPVDGRLLDEGALIAPQAARQGSTDEEAKA